MRSPETPEAGIASAAPGGSGRPVHPALAPALDELRATRRATIDLAAAAERDDLVARRPGPDQWSIGEVLDHLSLTDAIYLADLGRLYALAQAGQRPFIRRSFREIDASILFVPKALLPLLELPMSLVSRVMPKAARDLLVRSRVIPAQSPRATTPRHGRSGEELRNELAANLSSFEALFAEHPHVDPRELEHFHPLLGRNDVPGLLSFMTNHERRHHDQIREAARRLGSAAIAAAASSTAADRRPPTSGSAA